MTGQRNDGQSPQERLVHHVHTLERLAEQKREAAGELASGFKDAEHDGFDPATLKVVLKLRQLTPGQRRERRALEAIYLAALGMLDGDALPDVARRRLDGQPDDDAAPPAPPSEPSAAPPGDEPGDEVPGPSTEDAQRSLVLKTPDEAKQEGSEAAAAGKRIYDNPFPAGDPCRAAWDEGWCAQRKSHGMDAPAAYQRRSAKSPDQPPSTDAADTDAKGGA